MVAEYVRNSKAVLDSIMRFQDTKRLLIMAQLHIKNLQTENAALLVDKNKARNDANEMAARLWDCNQLYEDLQKKKRNANLERWIWRGVSVAGSALLLRGKIRDP